MIAVDTNILVQAHRRDATEHTRARRAVRTLAEGTEVWGLPWPCVHEFVAIVTHPRIYDPPSTPEQAFTQLRAWHDSPTVRLLGERDDHLGHLQSAVLDGGVTGPRVHDARIAALCRSHGVRELWTADRDFSRFPGLVTVNPLLPKP